MKKIVIRKYDSDWKDSGLDYQEEIAMMSTKNNHDDIYLALRNSKGSINSYNIIEIEHLLEEGVFICCCKFRSYENWRNQVELVARYFKSEFMTNPESLVVSHHTIVKLEEEESIAGNENGTQGIIEFKNFFLRIKMNSQIKEDEFYVTSRKVDSLQIKQKVDRIKSMIQKYEELKSNNEEILEYETLVRINRIIDILKSFRQEAENNKFEEELGDINLFIAMLTAKESIHLLEAINLFTNSKSIKETDALSFVLNQIELRLEKIRKML